MLTDDEMEAEYVRVRGQIVYAINCDIYDHTEEELKHIVAKLLLFEYTKIDAPISLGFFNRAGLPTVTVSRALKVVVESTMKEEEVQFDLLSQEALSASSSTIGQIQSFVEHRRNPSSFLLSEQTKKALTELRLPETIPEEGETKKSSTGGTAR